MHGWVGLVLICVTYVDCRDHRDNMSEYGSVQMECASSLREHPLQRSQNQSTTSDMARLPLPFLMAQPPRRHMNIAIY